MTGNNLNHNLCNNDTGHLSCTDTNCDMAAVGLKQPQAFKIQAQSPDQWNKVALLSCEMLCSVLGPVF